MANGHLPPEHVPPCKPLQTLSQGVQDNSNHLMKRFDQVREEIRDGRTEQTQIIRDLFESRFGHLEQEVIRQNSWLGQLDKRLRILEQATASHRARWKMSAGTVIALITLLAGAISGLFIVLIK